MRESVRLTITNIGRALLFTTISVVGGFFLFLAGSMTHIATFGLVIGITLVFALLADLLVSPALMTLIYRSRK